MASDNGVVIVNYPEGVPFFCDNIKGKALKGIAGLKKNELENLRKALLDSADPLKFKKVSDAGELNSILILVCMHSLYVFSDSIHRPCHHWCGAGPRVPTSTGPPKIS